MKTRFTKFFGRKDSSLENCSRAECIQIIEKLEVELTEATNSLEAMQSSKQTQTKELLKVQEELQLYKSHLETLQQETRKVSQELEDQRTLVSSRNHEVKILREALSSSGNLQPQPNRVADLETKLGETKQRLKALRTDKHQLEQTTDELQALVRGQQERISLLEAQAADQPSFTHKLRLLEEELEAKSRRIQKLEADAAIANFAAVQQKDVAKQLDTATAEIQALLQSSEMDKQQITRLNQDNKHLSEENQRLNEEIVHARSKLETVEGKRAIAKREVLRLTQRLQQCNVPKEPNTPTAPVRSLKGLPLSEGEQKAMCILKDQVNALYKGLMELMMGASTLKAADNSIHYQMTSTAFSLFEKEFNRLMMNIHEAAENPALIQTSEGWVSRFTNLMRLQPAKLASCMGRPQPGRGFH